MQLRHTTRTSLTSNLPNQSTVGVCSQTVQCIKSSMLEATTALSIPHPQRITPTYLQPPHPMYSSMSTPIRGSMTLKMGSRWGAWPYGKGYHALLLKGSSRAALVGMQPRQHLLLPALLLLLLLLPASAEPCTTAGVTAGVTADVTRGVAARVT